MARSALTNQESECEYAYLISALPNISAELLKEIADTNALEALCDLDVVDIVAALSPPGPMVVLDLADLPIENPDAAVEAVFNELRSRSIKLSQVSGALLLISGDEIRLNRISCIAESIRAPLHPQAQVAFGSYLDSSVVGKLSVKLILTGVSTLEEFVGPEENWQRKFERRWGILPPMDIPIFLRKPGSVAESGK